MAPGTKSADAAKPPRLRWVLLLAACGSLALGGECPSGGILDRTLDGSHNNPFDPTLGQAGTALLRIAEPDYADGVSAPAGSGRPSARAVSNAVHAQTTHVPNPAGASDFIWQWGQFLDHDIDLTEPAHPAEPSDIPVPAGDPFFDPFATGTQLIPLSRSLWSPTTGTGPGNPRQQVNQITAFIDASNLYGSDPARAAALRANDGMGRLATSTGGLLPFNTAGLPNAGGPDAGLFLAGDVRANEQVALTAMHTLFMREHNRIADALRRRHPGWGGDRIYRRTRRIVGALIQKITYDEFLPVLLGPGALAPYTGYDPGVDPRIANLFSTAAYRFGHSMLSPTLLRLGADGEPITEGHLALRDAFFAPFRITDEGGIDPLLRGLAAQVAQDVDVFVVDDVRNFLFGPPGSGGFDLPALNIQRGRDHGLPSYNDGREALGLARRASFAEVTSDPAVQARLASVYADVDEVDAWTGGLAEDAVPGALVGELVSTVLVEQFEALRDGDRFWYQGPFGLHGRGRRTVEATTLADVIRRNTGIGVELPDDPFHVP